MDLIGRIRGINPRGLAVLLLAGRVFCQRYWASY
jgi:hypothetical protein